jgi:hypothetical protein
MGDAATTVPQLPFTPPTDEVRWFHPWGSVTESADGKCEVHLGGTLLGWFGRDDRDRSMRNILLVTLAGEPKMHLGRLADAFGITEQYLWELRKKASSGGPGAVMLSRMGGKSKVSEQKRRQLRRWFAEDVSPTEAFRRQGRHGKKLSRATISRERAKWLEEEKTAAAVSSAIAALPTENTVAVVGDDAVKSAQMLLRFDCVSAMSETDGVAVDNTDGTSGSIEEVANTADRTSTDAEAEADAANATAAPDESTPVLPQRSLPVRSNRNIQHLGTWLMMALAQRDGLHDAASAIAGDGDAVRIALDAAIASLSIGEGTVEGVRRLGTPTGPLLLRVGHMPTASGVRRRLWSIGEQGGAELLGQISARYVAANRAEDDDAAVFFVDNHLRPYAGKHVVRKSWRMQDKRVRAGSTDYYVHDEDGRPMFRIEVPSHDSLTQWLTPIAMRLRETLGADERILLAFDRAGAFPTELAGLRDAGFEAVTYERKPFPELPTTAFDRAVVIRGETYQAHEGRQTNLGDGRGRVRRISLRTPEGSQINLLAVSSAPLERLVAILLGEPDRDDASGRWQQENAFHHGVERWGLNQLDGRKVVEYPPDTIIPNPRRRRIERALRLVRAEEGRARCQLAALASDDRKRPRVEEDLRDAIERRVHLEMIRPLHPKRAKLEDTELAGKLVHHRGELKAVLDTIRIVCANAESDLASVLAQSLLRPAEAKKVVANVLSASGSVTVTDSAIRIRLAPAANRNERVAIEDLFATLNAWNLTMPGDRLNRRMEVSLQP